MKEIVVYTDGATSSTTNGGTGPSGWGYVALVDGKEYQRNCGYKNSTNNRMELMAVIHAIVDLFEYGHLDEHGKVKIYTDSKYVISCFDGCQKWLEEGKPDVKNPDLIAKVLYLNQLFNVELEHVEGHSTNYYNNVADDLAVRARTIAKEFRLEDLPEN